VGSDTRTEINAKDYQVPFTFDGKIDKVTFDVGPMQLSEEDTKKAKAAAAAVKADQYWAPVAT
jgi:hypothetical protein